MFDDLSLPLKEPFKKSRNSFTLLLTSNLLFLIETAIVLWAWFTSIVGLNNFSTKFSTILILIVKVNLTGVSQPYGMSHTVCVNKNSLLFRSEANQNRLIEYSKNLSFQKDKFKKLKFYVRSDRLEPSTQTLVQPTSDEAICRLQGRFSITMLLA